MTFEEQIEKMIDERVAKILPEKISEALEALKPVDKITPNDPDIIKGYDALAAFLGVSRPTAIKLKQNRAFPYYQWGRVLFFKPDEVLAGMRRNGRV